MKQKTQTGSKRLKSTIGIVTSVIVILAVAGAIEWYQGAIQYWIGWCYSNGCGMKENQEKALKWVRRSAEKGYIPAECVLASYLGSESSDQKDINEAIQWLRRVIEQDPAHEKAQLALAFYLLKIEDNAVENKTEALNLIRENVERGEPLAQFLLAGCYKDGIGVEEDDEEAVNWCRKAAEQGLAEAQYALGFYCANGEGIEKDDAEAVKWYEKAAEQGNADAMYAIGKCYYDGTGVDVNKEEALKWWRKAAEQGNANAMYVIGVCYYNGEGVEKDDAEAVKWYEKAAEQGQPDAQEALKTYKSGIKDDINE